MLLRGVSYNMRQRAEDKNPFGISFCLLSTFTLLLFLRPQEMFEQFGTFGVQKMVGVAALMSILIRINLINISNFRNGIVKSLSFYMFFILLSIPLSLWPGGSLDYFQNMLLKEIVIFVVLVVAVGCIYELRKILLIIAFSNVFLACYTIFIKMRGVNLVERYRAALSQGVFADPNDLAANFVIAIPLMYFLGKKSSKIRFFYLLSILVTIVGTLSTYSQKKFDLVCFGGFRNSCIISKYCIQDWNLLEC